MLDFDSEYFKKNSGWQPGDQSIFKKPLTLTHLAQGNLEGFNGALDVTVYPTSLHFINVRVVRGDGIIAHDFNSYAGTVIPSKITNLQIQGGNLDF